MPIKVNHHKLQMAAARLQFLFPTSMPISYNHEDQPAQNFSITLRPKGAFWLIPCFLCSNQCDIDTFFYLVSIGQFRVGE